jgi:fibronectin-binding autotransporter adhesin
MLSTKLSLRRILTFTRLRTVFSIILVLGVSSARAATNSWIDTSGSSLNDFWDNSGAWLLGDQPTISDSFDLITNATSKVVVIDDQDTMFDMETLTVSNVVLSAPVGVANVLFLQNGGLTVPLDIVNSLIITNGGMLWVSNAYVRVDGVSGGSCNVGAGGALVFDSGSIVLNAATFASSATLQFALGSNSVAAVISNNLVLGGTLNITDAGGFTNATYTLFTYGGALTYSGLTIGATPNPSVTYTITNTPGQVKLLVGGGSSPPSPSTFQITSIARQSSSIVLTWTASGGTSNTVQATNGSGNGSYNSSGFADISSLIIIPGTGTVTTNYTDVGGATNLPARYYRVSLAPGNAAADNAGNSTYSNFNWSSGLNGGYGFGPWVFVATSPFNGSGDGFFIGSSINNAGTNSPGIDVKGFSWGMYANTGNTSTAFRAFNGPLQVGQSVLINMDNGYINTGNSVGFILRNGNATNATTDAGTGARFQFQYIGNDASNSYKVVDSSGQQNIGMPFTGTGLRLKFTLTGANTYTLVTTDNATGAINTFSGTLSGSGSINSIALFNRNAGSGPNFDAYFNSLQLTGLPSQ